MTARNLKKVAQIHTVFTEEFAALWRPMWFEDGSERKTNAFRIKEDICQKPHHPEPVLLHLPEWKTPQDMIGKVVSLHINFEISNAGNHYTKLRVYEPTYKAYPKWETLVPVVGEWGKSSPGLRYSGVSFPGNVVEEVDNMGIYEFENRVFIVKPEVESKEWLAIWLDLTNCRYARCFMSTHVIFRKIETKERCPVKVTRYWHGMRKLVYDKAEEV